MKKRPKISVIIPVYNVLPYLEQCLNSVSKQSFQDWECIIVDDGSTDGCSAFIDCYIKEDTRFSVIHKKNEGLAAARQSGLEVAHGEYVVHIDSDDYVDIDHLLNLVSIAENEKADIVLEDYYIDKSGQQILMHQCPSSLKKKSLVCETLRGRYHAGLWCKIFKRELITKNSIPQAPFSYYEDMFTYLSCLHYALNVVYAPYATYHYRYNEQSMTNDKDLQKRVNMFEQCMNNLLAIQELSQYRNDDDFIKATYYRANYEKAQLLGNASHYAAKKPYLMKYFPDSPTIIKITDFRSWGLKNALNGNVIPYLLFKACHFSGRMIHKFFSEH